MNETLTLVVAGLAGVVLGAFFFGGLWWTVRKGIGSNQAALWFACSLLLRTGITLLGFYLVGRGNWKRLVGGLLGFVIARFIVMRLTRTRIEHPRSTVKEAGHAP